MARSPSTVTFPRAGLRFLDSLSRNNSKDWFQTHKEEYRSSVQQPMLALVRALNTDLRRFAPRYENTLTSPLSRPNRDTRFAKDKSPYRTDVAVVFPLSGREKHECAGFFVRVSPQGAELIAGAYMPGPEQLKALRAWIGHDWTALERRLRAPTLRAQWGPLEGAQLKRVPKPFAADHAAAHQLRRTQFYLRRLMPPTTVTSTGFAAQVSRAFRAATPFVDTLNRVLTI